MDIINTIILSVVEGVTEFLPISSTGHLILASRLLQIPQSEFLKTFEISIQFGAICAVVFLYWKKLLTGTDLVKKVLVAFLPTAVVGFFLYPIIKSIFFENELITIVSLLLGGIFLIFFEKYFVTKNRTDFKNLSYKNSLIIGLVQSISVIPGVSRAAATIVGGMFTGLNKVSATEFSFFLAVPTMFAATGFDLLKTAGDFRSTDYVSLGIGFVLSFVMAILSIKFLISFVKKNSFVGFGVYRIILALLYSLFVLK